MMCVLRAEQASDWACRRHSVSLPQLCVKVKELAIVNYANRSELVLVSVLFVLVSSKATVLA